MLDMITTGDGVLSIIDWTAVFLLLVAASSLTVLLWTAIPARSVRRRMGWILVAAGTTAYWFMQVVARLAFDYVGPSVAFSTFGIIKDSLVAMTALAMSIAFLLDHRDGKG